ncbi:MBL fold metallo-hydrolase [Pyxidicoccus xibeiensis]|uniref:MBL fold metallo-hydrolase n=1 Tax=Pyxidicoccus xibeiensis TaxID=2906759 RepID=UPI0020A7F5F2|nr:MBL fold metallo-hydrolase [Pyxidicoccus xibeiensis]MCP3141058.1 MBL fold metallo-hydrolase [Pyxidicoccus xibeiensis]
MRFMLLASLLAVVGCASPARHHRYSNSVEEQGDTRVGQYLSSSWSFMTSSFWIEGPEGLVLIDTQFLPSALKKEVHYAEGVTGKKVVLAIVLHPNPDRFNGTAWLRERGVRVVTSQQVRDLIPAVHERWAPVYFEKYWNGRYPRTLVLPEAFGAATQELSAGGLTLKAHVLGTGCSPAHVVVEWEGHLFVGDLVANGTHSWVENGRIDEWLRRLDELRALRPRWVHPGRGLSGGPELLERQTEYLQAVVAAVSEEQPRGRSTPEALERISQRVSQRYPDHEVPGFLPRVLRAEWARQVAEAASAPTP